MCRLCRKTQQASLHSGFVTTTWEEKMEETVNIWHESSNRTTPSWSMCQSFQSENHYTGNTQMSEMTCQYLGCFMRSMWTQTRIERRRTNRTKLSKPNPPPKKTSTFKGRAAAGSETKEGGREKQKICWWGEKKKKTEREGGLLSGGHFGCHLSPWRRGPGPQKPLGRTDCLRGARYFLQHHLSLSPHNDSPRSSLLMFVIALSHKGGWSMEPRGASRGQEMSDCCLSV